MTWEKVAYIIAVSASPVVELRGAIPLAVSMGISPLSAFLISVMGNLLPVPLLLVVFSPITAQLRETKLLKKIFSWLEERTRRKASLVQKYEFWGLVLFVAIPFPTTGAWTGSFAASIFKLNYKLSLLAITLGVIIAGIIVSVVTVAGRGILR
ncbi:MAG: small multi-drug export protein [Candidatus Omnitrophica bacterium]|nr:small multi-drug export protein [Candidatus Omnitrophota bacterium]